jgi:ribose 5-phosphate isomerase B
MICIASDHAATDLKAEVVNTLKATGLEIEDLGTSGFASVDYPDFAHRIAERVADEPGVLGILICGTGIGMSMAANRHRGVRAALCHDAFTAEMARRHNDANVLCIGARVVGVGVALQIVDIFLNSPFEGDRHLRRVQKIELAVEER